VPCLCFKDPIYFRFLFSMSGGSHLSDQNLQGVFAYAIVCWKKTPATNRIGFPTLPPLRGVPMKFLTSFCPPPDTGSSPCTTRGFPPSFSYRKFRDLVRTRFGCLGFPSSGPPFPLSPPSPHLQLFFYPALGPILSNSQLGLGRILSCQAFLNWFANPLNQDCWVGPPLNAPFFVGRFVALSLYYHQADFSSSLPVIEKDSLVTLPPQRRASFSRRAQWGPLSQIFPKKSPPLGSAPPAWLNFFPWIKVL